MSAEAIELMLMDGDPSGRWTAELLNWPGKAYKIPRTQIKACSNVPELQRPGVYFLLGQTDWNDTPRVYIGEAENVAKRLKEHLNAGKDFWNEVITFTSIDNHLNKAHIKYIEHHLHKMAKEAGRYEVENGGTPTKSALSDYAETYANKFMDCIKIVIGVFGHHLFESLKQENSESTQQNAYLTFKMGKVNAMGCRHPEGFLVFSGSTMNETSKGERIRAREFPAQRWLVRDSA